MITILEKCLVKHEDLLSNIEYTATPKKINIKEKDEEKIIFAELGRDMFKNNSYILNKYFRNEYGQECFYANLFSFPKEMPLYALKKALKKDFGKDVSLKGYRNDSRHYKFVSCYLQNEYEEDLFREKSKEEEFAECLAERKARIEPIDFNAVEILYAVLFKALKQRYIMLFNLESVPAIIHNAFDCYYLGVSCGASNAAMHAKIEEIRRIVEDPNVIKWLKTGASDMNFDKEDYIDTYQRVLRTLTGIRDTSLEEVKDLIHNEYDLFEEEILENNCIEFDSYIENNYTEDEVNYLD